MSRVMCENCGEETDHKHLHNAAHGIAGTHMAGSERYECVVCGKAIYKKHLQARGLDLKFILD